jgi:hypothetical protein
LGEFSTIRPLFVGPLGFFEIMKWPKNGDTFGYKFQINNLFKNMVCILALFGLATVLATFHKILGNFFQNKIIWSPWL